MFFVFIPWKKQTLEKVILMMSRLGIPVERIAARLKINRNRESQRTWLEALHIRLPDYRVVMINATPVICQYGALRGFALGLHIPPSRPETSLEPPLAR